MSAWFFIVAALFASSSLTPGERLSRSWREYLAAPFAHDTLAALAGYSPVVITSSARAPLGQSRLAGLTLPYGLPASDTNPTEVRLYQDRADDHLISHELGHVVYYRVFAPQVTDSIRELFRTRKPRFTYGGGRIDYADADFAAEYIAETFALALDAVRTHADVEKLDQRYPGAALWAAWIRSRLSHGV